MAQLPPPQPHYAKGGMYVASGNEPIVGIGKYSGKKKLEFGEAGPEAAMFVPLKGNRGTATLSKPRSQWNNLTDFMQAAGMKRGGMRVA